MIRGEYWWIYCREDGLDWSEWLAGESVPLREGHCKEPLEVPAPDGASLVLCVPGARVRIYNVIAPARNRKRFLAALPYALEDKLLHPPEDYHFAPLKGKVEKTLPVAVISAAYIESLLSAFRQRDWQVQLLLPDYLFLKPADTGWILDVTETPFLLRRSGLPGGAAIAGELATHPPGPLILALEEAGTPPAVLQVRVASNKDRQKLERWPEALEAYSLQLDIVEDARPRAASLSRCALPDTDMNLLTGDYAISGQTRKQLQQFRPAATLAVAVLLVLATNWFLSGARLRSDYREVQTAIEQTYREVFPDARNLVDPRYQMEQQLIRLSAARSRESEPGFDFLTGLERLAAVVGDMDSQLQGIEFDGSDITIDISVANYEALENLQRQLASFMEPRVDTAELRDGRVHSRIHLETGI